MFCFQCEQTAKGTGCTAHGVCGKDPETADLQDLLIYAAKGIAMYAHRARQLGAKDRAVDVFVVEALFSTVTNVNFDPKRLEQRLRCAHQVKEVARQLYEQACKTAGKQPETLSGPAAWTPADNTDDLIRQGEAVSIEDRIDEHGEDVAGLEELLTYGLKGTAAYADHAMILGREDDEVYAFFHEALDFLASGECTVAELLAMVLRCGEVNLKVMGSLDAAHTETYGHPEPTSVRITPARGKAILVSGHDLKDLAALLEQTEGKGVNVYTHGEMLPAHAYPKLKKYKHLVGNYGGAWQDQRKEFDEFPGAILMTTNCIQRPKDSYKGRIFTSGLVAWPGVTHIDDGDFAPVIEAALSAEGFARDEPEKSITVGFGHHAVGSVAGKVVDAVKQGAIRHFFLIGGCDGAKPGRSYYTELAEKVPDDCVILTLACGKYRFNKLDFGDIGGIPRLLDVGQCNDAYSAIQIAASLAEAFGCGVNDLPLSMVLSWYEQKAVCILLTLLHLGIRNVRLGPSLPAFVSPNVLKVLVDKFNIAPITTPDADLEAILGAATV
ncbi:MAG TPA: hydroxylamine reductase [Phycisphaerae bacterium]|nr:hydroxylamine reductase [Phycisphaerae bacterium]